MRDTEVGGRSQTMRLFLFCDFSHLFLSVVSVNNASKQTCTMLGTWNKNAYEMQSV